MKLMLDTHVLIWWLEDSPRLGQTARILITDSDNDVMISVATPWEASIKHRLGKLDHKGAEVLRAAERLGVRMVGLDTRHLVALEAMPLHHRDPFDRMIVAQAAIERAVIITDDTIIPEYGVRCLPV